MSFESQLCDFLLLINSNQSPTSHRLATIYPLGTATTTDRQTDRQADRRQPYHNLDCHLSTKARVVLTCKLMRLRHVAYFTCTTDKWMISYVFMYWRMPLCISAIISGVRTSPRVPASLLLFTEPTTYYKSTWTFVNDILLIIQQPLTVA